MKVRDLIARLQEMDPELPVTVNWGIPGVPFDRGYVIADDYSMFEFSEASYSRLEDRDDGAVVLLEREGPHLRIG